MAVLFTWVLTLALSAFGEAASTVPSPAAMFSVSTGPQSPNKSAESERFRLRDQSKPSSDGTTGTPTRRVNGTATYDNNENIHCSAEGGYCGYAPSADFIDCCDGFTCDDSNLNSGACTASKSAWPWVALVVGILLAIWLLCRFCWADKDKDTTPFEDWGQMSRPLYTAPQDEYPAYMLSNGMDPCTGRALPGRKPAW